MIRSLIVACLVLLLGGVFLRPLAEDIQDRERQMGLLPPVLALGDESGPRLEQQLSFVALGGLRSLVAAFLSLNAYEHFSNRNWPALENRYRQITALAPQNNYYWDNGGWHLTYNASSDSLEDTSLRDTERKIRFKSYIKKGRDFLREGTKNNPGDWLLHSRLADALADNNRLPDHEAAILEYRKARELGGPLSMERAELYSMASLPAREKDAYDLAVKLFQSAPENKVPSIECLIFALQKKLDIPLKDKIPPDKIFFSPKSAAWSLKNYYRRPNNFPKKGIQEALEVLKPYQDTKSWADVPNSDLEALQL